MDPQLQPISRESEAHAFASFYHQHYQRCYQLASVILHSREQAEDIVQEVFAKVWTQWEQRQAVQDWNSFIITVTRNLITDKFRKQTTERRALRQWERLRCDSRGVTEDMVSDALYRKCLQEAIQQLSPQRRKVFVLGKLEGWKREKIARTLGISECTVKATMQMALKDIYQYLEKRTGIQRKVFSKKAMVVSWKRLLDAA